MVPAMGSHCKTLIAGEYVTQMVARLDRGVLAVPVHSAGADGYHRTPGSIAISSAVEVPNDVAAAIAAIPNISFASVFSTTSPPLVSCVCLNKHRNSAPLPC